MVGMPSMAISRHFRLPKVPSLSPRKFARMHMGSMMCKPKAAEATKNEHFFDFRVSLFDWNDLDFSFNIVKYDQIIEILVMPIVSCSWSQHV